MTFLKRALLALALLVASALPAAAQWQVANHSLPVGKGPGFIGFGSIAPAANTKFLVGAGTSADPVFATMSGDCGLVAGAVTCTSVNGVSMPSSGTSGGIPYYSSSSAISSSAALTANRLVIGGGAGVAPSVLGSLGTTTTLLHGNASGAPTFAAVGSSDLSITTTSCSNQFVTAISSGGVGTCTTDTLASAQHANQGTTTTLLHGNAAGNPSWASVVSADLNITTTSCTNQFVTAISAGGVGTCTTDTLAGAQHANQGTTTQVLHGNGSGNPSWGQVAIGSDVSGLATGVATALATPSGANLAAAFTDETGSGLPVFNSGPALTGTLDVQQALKLSGDTSPSQITSNQNDYAPANFSTSSILRLNSDASRNITGLAGGADGLVKIIANVGSFNIVLTNADTNSSAANRFALGGDVTLAADQSIAIQYDSTSSRWRAVTTGGGGGGGGGGVTSVAIAAGTGITTSGTCTITSSGTCTVTLDPSAAETWSGLQQFNDGKLALKGATSGTVTLKAAATAGSNTLTFPAGTTDFSATGGTSQVVKQTSSGGALTVARLACSDLSNSGTGCSANAGLTLGADTATTSGSTITFTGLSGVKQITLSWRDGSTNGTNSIGIQLGTGGSLTTSGYTGGTVSETVSAVTVPRTSWSSMGVAVSTATAASVYYMTAVCTLVNSSSNIWQIQIAQTNPSANSTTQAMASGVGYIALAGTVDRIALLTSDTFDAGSVNIAYQ